MSDPYVRMIVGDSLSVLRSLPAASVDLVLTSPPFLALRSYLPADHPDKAAEMGAESNPGAYIDALLTVTEECRRVLAPHGSLCFELGDTYSGSGGAGGDYDEGGLREGQPKFKVRPEPKSAVPDAKYGPGRTWEAEREKRASKRSGMEPHPGWPAAKSLCLIPEIFRFALVYGFNPLTQRQTPQWLARNVIRWCRPNPPVGSLGDKVRPGTSEMVMAAMGPKRYFDLDAIRTPLKEHSAKYNGGTRPGYGERGGQGTIKEMAPGAVSNAGGAPPNDHWWANDDRFDQDAWLISTQPYKGAHYATFPERLVTRPILAMCPERVCRTCGKPSERIVAKTAGYQAFRKTRTDSISAKSDLQRARHLPEKGGVGSLDHQEATDRTDGELYQTVGWTDCGHDDWRPGVVLDPFGGSGTVGAVAYGHNRSAILIDIDERNVALTDQRIGLFLTVEDFEPPEAVPAP